MFTENEDPISLVIVSHAKPRIQQIIDIKVRPTNKETGILLISTGVGQKQGYTGANEYLSFPQGVCMCSLDKVVDHNGVRLAQ